jgi:hypothetical protein
VALRIFTKTQFHMEFFQVLFKPPARAAVAQAAFSF